MRVIHCGFCEISSSDFRNSTLKKGRKLFLAGHVDSVREEVTDNTSVIFGQCLPQTSIRNKNYIIKLNVSEERKILSGCCSCKAGVQGQCKHAAALLTYVNEYREVSCTNAKQKWGIPTVKAGYSQGKRLSQLFPAKLTSSGASTMTLQDALLKFPGIDCPLFHVMEIEESSSVERACISVIDDLLESVCTMELSEILEKLQDEKLDPRPYFAYEVTKAKNATSIRLQRKVYSLKPDDERFLKEKINISPLEIRNYAVQTVLQSDSILWHKLRSVRVSSSMCHQIITRRDNFEKLATKIITSSFAGNAATNYGQKLEKAAKSSFAFKNNVHIVDCGVVISETFPWLCCSPDGLYGYPDLKLLEVKCPYTRKGKNIVDIASLQSYVPYLKFSGQQIKLKESHQYYAQVQISLLVLKLKVCSLYVYSAVDQVKVVIYRDDEYLKKSIHRLEWFYYTYLLPKIVSKQSE